MSDTSPYVIVAGQRRTPLHYGAQLQTGQRPAAKQLRPRGGNLGAAASHRNPLAKEVTGMRTMLAPIVVRRNAQVTSPSTNGGRD